MCNWSVLPSIFEYTLIYIVKKIFFLHPNNYRYKIYKNRNNKVLKMHLFLFMAKYSPFITK